MTVIQRTTMVFLFLSLVVNGQSISKPEGDIFSFLNENPFEIVPETSNLPTNTINKKMSNRWFNF
jgi:hypothetical protein